MRQISYALGLLGLLSTLVVTAQARGDSMEPTKNERRICKVVAPTGTRIAKRTCLTEAQWEQARLIAQEATEKGQVSALMINMAGGGGGG